jgi:PAS domain S-box-containing protein
VLELGDALAGALGVDPDAAVVDMPRASVLLAPPGQGDVLEAFFSFPASAKLDLVVELPLPGPSAARVRWMSAPFHTEDKDPGFLLIGWPEKEWPKMVSHVLMVSRIVDLTSEAVVFLDSAGTVEFVNPAFLNMSGFTPGGIIGTPVSAIVSIPEDITIMQDALARFRRFEMWSGPVRVRRADGGAMHMNVRVQPICDSEGERRRYIVVGTDISRQHSLERQVEELQRLESLGTLANGLAHRFNNILAAISGQTELLIMSCRDEEMKHRAEKILESSLKGKEVVEQIALFGRKGEARARLADLVPVVRNAVRFIRAAQPRAVTIVEDIPEESPSIMANTGEIHQVLLNLLTNALEAVGERHGTIRISLCARLAVLPSSSAPQQCVVFEVADDGPGIDPKVRPRLFEPFFTTHGLANSSGMGLAIAHGIVQRHGGVIECESELGHGATFRVVLPVQRLDVRAAPAAKGGMRRILLVDKPGYALDSGRRVLEEMAYQVDTATTETEAAAMLEKTPAYNLLISSVHPGEGDGIELARRSRRLRSGLPVLLCANLKEVFDEEAAIDAGASAILRRPATREQLADIVGKLMDCSK